MVSAPGMAGVTFKGFCVVSSTAPISSTLLLRLRNQDPTPLEVMRTLPAAQARQDPALAARNLSRNLTVISRTNVKLAYQGRALAPESTRDTLASLIRGFTTNAAGYLFAISAMAAVLPHIANMRAVGVNWEIDFDHEDIKTLVTSSEFPLLSPNNRNTFIAYAIAKIIKTDA